MNPEISTDGRGLPTGWVRTTLGEIGLYHNGRGFKKSEWRQTGRPIIRIQNLTDPSKPFNHYQGEVDPRIEVSAGDILVSWAATLGAYRWSGPEAVLNQHIFKVESFVSREFHYYLLQAVLDDLERQAHGSGMVHITRGKFLKTPILLPPRAEQDRIVEAVESAMEALAEGEESLNRGETLAVALRQSLIDRCVEAADVSRRSLGDCLKETLANGRSVPTATEGFPVLRLTAIKDGSIDTDEAKIGEWTASVACQYLVQKGDFLVSRGNGSLDLVGRGGLITHNPPPVAFPDTAIRVRTDESILRGEFLRLIWDSHMVRQQIERQARTTAGIHKINQATLARIQIPVPSVPEQDRLVRETRERMRQAERAKREFGSATQAMPRLRRSTLHRAFTGQLVPQDPNDEPASALLERIKVEKAEREAELKAQRRQARANGKSAKGRKVRGKTAAKA